MQSFKIRDGILKLKIKTKKLNNRFFWKGEAENGKN